jgi:hypothetical protein
MVDRGSKPCGAVRERSIKVEDGEVIAVHCIVYYCQRQVVIRPYAWGRLAWLAHRKEPYARLGLVTIEPALFFAD